jgi:hypothetical protein
MSQKITLKTRRSACDSATAERSSDVPHPPQNLAVVGLLKLQSEQITWDWNRGEKRY